jgi:hypothetical protein
LEKPRHRMRQDFNWILFSAWKKRIGGTPSEHPPYSPDLAPCDFWVFPTMKRELRGKKFRSAQWSAAGFREVLWSLVRSASPPKGGTSKNRPSPHHHKVPTRSNKVSLRNFNHSTSTFNFTVEVLRAFKRLNSEVTSEEVISRTGGYFMQ